MPPQLFGYSDGVEGYEYDPDIAKQLIAESGVTNPTLEFWYPTERQPAVHAGPAGRTSRRSRRDLEAVGFKIIPKSAPWTPDYLQQSTPGNGPGSCTCSAGPATSVTRTTSSARSSGQGQPEWGFDNPAIFSALNEARDRDRPGQADGAVPGGQQADHGLPAGRSVRPHPAAARVRRRTSAATCRARSRWSRSPSSPRLARSLTRHVLKFVVRRLLLLVPILLGLSVLRVRCGSGPCPAVRRRHCWVSGRRRRPSRRGRVAATAWTGRSTSSTCTYVGSGPSGRLRPVAVDRAGR